jgi:hypothetical protein
VRVTAIVSVSGCVATIVYSPCLILIFLLFSQGGGLRLCVLMNFADQNWEL